LGLGVLVVLVGGAVILAVGDRGRGGHVILAIGLVLVVMGGVALGRAAYYQRNPQVGRQVQLNERDERMILIRTQAGNRAFWLSSALTFALLMWASFPADFGLPSLTLDRTWFALAVTVVTPLLVYVGGIVYGQSRS
jgi:hypothetical protein